MKTKVMLAAAIAAAVGLTGVTTTAMAAPLPAGTKLTITPWVNPAVPLLDEAGCTYGSCFGIGVYGTLYGWTPMEPGTDGGLIIGKPQKSGGQNVNLASTNPGEIDAQWDFGGNHGTSFTAPGSINTATNEDVSKNIFSDTSCTGSGCGSNTTPRVTDLFVWNMAWGANHVPMGSAAGCIKTLLSNCTPDQVAGIFVNSWTVDTATPRNYELKYKQITPVGWPNQPFALILRGTIGAPTCGSPRVSINGTSAAVNLSVVSGQTTSFTIAVSDPGCTVPPTCRAVFTSPINGLVTLNGCVSGTYKSDTGYIGVNSFNIIANDSVGDSNPDVGGKINIAVTPIIDPTPLISPTPTTIPTIPPSPTACTDLYPVKQLTLAGKQGHLSVTVTGNITQANANGKEIKICPLTTASYVASSNTPGASVVCKLKSNTARGQGQIKVNDHVKCTDKPVGNDKIYFKVKSGEYKKAQS